MDLEDLPLFFPLFNSGTQHHRTERHWCDWPRLPLRTGRGLCGV
jgi:hypothetical protein